jgi:hypothetical protein
MAKFFWTANNTTIEGWHTTYILYNDGSIYRYATLEYAPHKGPKGTWRLKLRHWEGYQDIEEAQVCAPPKEYVESLVLLSYDIGVNDG